ncbi:hypothetical protein GCWU000324_02432 [Kingella oralis ATCC 51147]|uniref:Uncharacterized protein n=1 Tax=Kingella oralis ATCC 51147 TaxID=629741 RepID=C4GK58_9NEIS|nr:hypothetical protein GCWU000324_02432 [Kingella oralis ATCC 51147]
MDAVVGVAKGFEPFKTFAAVVQAMRARGEGKFAAGLPTGWLPCAVFKGENGHFGVEYAAKYGGDFACHVGSFRVCEQGLLKSVKILFGLRLGKFQAAFVDVAQAA